MFQGLVTTMGGFAFARLKFPGRNALFLIYLGTLMIPPQVTLIPTFIVVVKLHWINTYQGLIVPIVAQGAFGTFMFRQFFLKIPNDLYESARLDGANPWQLYWRLTIPLEPAGLDGVRSHHLPDRLEHVPLAADRGANAKLQVVPMAIAEMSSGAGVDRGIVMAAVSLSILPIFVFGSSARNGLSKGSR